MARLRVALTGGVASGKSRVAETLGGLGAVVIDSDRLAREVVEPGTPGLAEVVRAFGEEVLDEEGRLDRPALGRLVFADAAARRRLEGILHPLIRELGARREAEAPPEAIVVHDIPLLVETGQEGLFDAVLVVDAPEEAQVERMTRLRGWTREDAEARLRAQASRERRRAAATHVVENTGTLEDLRERVTEVFEQLVSTGSTGS
ncbi:MAG TPA: dephospho-CoA kinase [Nocardioidaceae bacterium]|nr:dephospho-CoA kinase [Nocardioidaceae bacterium]